MHLTRFYIILIMKKNPSLFYCSIFLFLLNLSLPTYATPQVATDNTQNPSQTVMFYFRFDRSLLEKDYMGNRQSLDTLRSIMTDSKILSRIDSIVIKASASPEGAFERNQLLARERAKAIKDYLAWQYPELDKAKIHAHSIGENWEGLKQMVEADTNVPHQQALLNIINSGSNPRNKDIRIRQLGGGTTFAYITQHMLRYLRTGAACVIFYRAPEAEPVPEIVEKIEYEAEVSLPPTPINIEPEETTWIYKRPFSIKTNLLFDAITALNIELEIPLGRKFSVATEWIFPWWLWEDKQYCLELLSGSVEGRYWLKPNYSKQDESLGKHNPLTGWFIGLYGSMGKYDLEWNKKGYQGEFALSTGLSVGYVQPLSRNLNMEFSMSAGYLQTDYRFYHAQQDMCGDWHLIKQYPGTLRWFGPTKAKVSLVWYPHFKSKKKGNIK